MGIVPVQADIHMLQHNISQPYTYSFLLPVALSLLLCQLFIMLCCAVLQIISCLSNLIKDHMMGGEDEAMLNPADDCCGPSSDCCQPSGDLCHDSGCDHTANGHTGLPAQHQLSGSDEEKGAGKSEEEDGDDSDQADLVLPAAYSLAVAQLLSAHSCAVNVKDIKLDGDEMKLDLAATMWKEGILSARPEVSKSEPCKKLKK